MVSFVDRHGVDSFDHVVDPEGSEASIWERFGIVTQPAWVFVNDDGSTETVVGLLGEEGLNAEIDALLSR
jgi:hypothetical protein